MEKQCGIYSITNRVNGRRYVGSTADCKQRWRKHKRLLRAKKHDNKHLQNAWCKYGEDAFDFTFELAVKKPFLLWVEQIYLNANEGGYNKNPIAFKPPSCRGKKLNDKQRAALIASNKSRRMSQEQKDILLAAKRAKGFPKHTEVARAKISAGLRGKKRAPRGPMPEEIRRKIADKLRGRKRPPELVARFMAKVSEFGPKISAAKMGHPVSEETKQKIRLANLGKRQSAELKAKQSAIHLGKKLSIEARRHLLHGKGYFQRGNSFSIECGRYLGMKRFSVHSESEAISAVAKIREQYGLVPMNQESYSCPGIH